MYRCYPLWNRKESGSPKTTNLPDNKAAGYFLRVLPITQNTTPRITNTNKTPTQTPASNMAAMASQELSNTIPHSRAAVCIHDFITIGLPFFSHQGLRLQMQTAH
jgi:hypothetical protein